MKKKMISFCLFLFIAIMFLAHGCSKGNKSEEPLTPSDQGSIKEYHESNFVPLGLKKFRLDCKTGDISEIPLRSEDWNPIMIGREGITSPHIDIALHLTAVDPDYNTKLEANNGLLQENLSQRQIAVRFWISILNKHCGSWSNPSTDYFFITSPRAIFAPIQSIGVPVEMTNADGKLNINLSSYGVSANPGPYYYKRLLGWSQTDETVWEIKPNNSDTPSPFDPNNCDDYLTDKNISRPETCEMVFPVNSLEVPDFVDWFVIIDGMIGTGSLQTNNIWFDPYKISGLEVERESSIPNYVYDDLWDLDILRIGDSACLWVTFDITGDGSYDNTDTYHVFAFANGQTFPQLGHFTPGHATSVSFQSPTFAVNDFLGQGANSPSGMYPFEIRVKKNSDSDYYLSQKFKIPVVNPNIQGPTDLFQAGYYIISGVHSGPKGNPDVTRLSLMNSFTGEIHECKDGETPLAGIYNISMQKAVGGTIDYLRIGYEYGSQGPPVTTQIAVWEWTPSGENLYGQGQNNYNTDTSWGVGYGLSPFQPCMGPQGDVLAWAAAAKRKYDEVYVCPYIYKDYWRYYDGFASKYDFSLNHQGTNENDNWPEEYLFQFDWHNEWKDKTNPSSGYPNRCGDCYDSVTTSYYDLQDKTWLYEPAIAGPGHYDVLPTIGDTGFATIPDEDEIYTLVFTYGGDCSQEYAALQFYFFKYKDPSNSDFEVLYKCKFAPNEYWESPNHEEYRPYKGWHTGYETMFSKPKISSDATSLVFEAIEGGMSKIYIIYINHNMDSDPQNPNYWLISSSAKVGLSPMAGSHQYKPCINTSFWNGVMFESLDASYIAYQDGIDNGTDIWIALGYAPGQFGHYNLTGPFGLGFKSFSGQPDASTGVVGAYIRSGLVFTSQEYANGDLFLVDHVIDNGNPSGTHWTKLRRMTNYGEVMEAKISDFVWIY